MADDALTQLFFAARQGDPADFDRIIRESQDYAYALAYRMLLDAEEAADAVQEAFIRVWQRRFEFDGRVKFTTWLCIITSNLCKDRRKAIGRRVRAIGRYHIWLGDRSKEDMEEKAAHQDLTRWILKLAGDLPPQQHIAFVLRDLQDLSIDEVRAITGQTRGAIKTNLYLARKYLRGRMTQLNLLETPDENM